MNTTEAKIRNLERQAALNEWKLRVLATPTDGELDITCNDDRAMEANITAWTYRLKRDGIFFRREIRGRQVFLVRYK